eukprot:gnl/TRDRNA2_/TRDRNA2_71836_c0_seq1.p1 gnl/TRDRNA2_/TRDRNA2_71836_c0~~gnl/TRDRNA2_/TRDRNA2_71836_c0_seq1.p1  ORF type:complete len:360 (+),score=62.17 gnl/TRDRNA2_/TRDRNA2_71836_c0_seq1:2-1081(+)
MSAASTGTWQGVMPDGAGYFRGAGGKGRPLEGWTPVNPTGRPTVAQLHAAAPKAVKLNRHGFPVRPGAQPCDYYMKFRQCKYKANCAFDHPEELPDIQAAGLNRQGLPLRPGAPRCATWLRTGSCQYGAACKCDHPESEPVTGAPVQVESLFTMHKNEKKRLAATMAASEIARNLTIGGAAPAPGPAAAAAQAPAAVPVPQPAPPAPPADPQEATVALPWNCVSCGEPNKAARSVCNGCQKPRVPQALQGLLKATTPAVETSSSAPSQPAAAEAGADGAGSRKRRRGGWDKDEVAASSSAAAVKSVAEMLKTWTPTEQQLEAMSVEDLQTVLKQWKAHTTFTTKEPLLRKAKKVLWNIG